MKYGLILGLALACLLLSCRPLLAQEEGTRLSRLGNTVVRIDNPLGPDKIRSFDEIPDQAIRIELRHTFMQRDLYRTRTLIMDQMLRTPGFSSNPVYDRPLLPGRTQAQEALS